MKSIGTAIVILGAIIIAIGILFLVIDKIPFAGRLPGDIALKTRRGSFYFPITTCIIISVILTLVLNVIFRIFK